MALAGNGNGAGTVGDDTEDGNTPQDRSRLSVCFVCSDYPPGPHGGIGTMTQLLARELASRGHAVRVAGVYPSTYPADDLHDDQGVQVVRLREPRHPLGWVLARARLARLIERWVARREVDMVEVPDWQGWAAGWPALPIPVVVRLHGSGVYFAAERGGRAGSLTRRLETSSLRRADFICSTSRYTADRTAALFGLRNASTSVLYNPVAIPPAGSQRRTAGRVVFTGTLTEKKGVVPLIRAWPLVVRHVPGAELHLYGKDEPTGSHPSMQAHLISLLPEALRPSVRFLGHVPRGEIMRALAGASAAVFPSYAEAFALAPIEAMGSGTPTVYSRRGSGPELIRDGHDGLLVDPDRLEEIAFALVRLLTNDMLARSLGAAGRKRVTETFAPDRLVPANLAFYRQCIAEHRGRHSQAAS